VLHLALEPPFKKTAGKDLALERAFTQSEVDTITAKMTWQQKALFFESHIAVRENINHASISGPFETGCGYSEFDGAGFSGRIGLPALPGQSAHLRPQNDQTL
jgi:hypothetical protein